LIKQCIFRKESLREIEKLKTAKKYRDHNLVFKSFFLLSAFKKLSDERKNKFYVLLSKQHLILQRKIFNILVIKMSKIKKIICLFSYLLIFSLFLYRDKQIAFKKKRKS